MKNNPIKYFLVFSALGIGFWNCSCDRKEPDPCKGVPNSTAEFNSLNYRNKADTFLNSSTVFFKALDTTANSYEWQFGNDPKVYAKSYKQSLYFDKNTTGIIKATLKIKKKKNTYSCYPNDDSIKTFSKTILLVPNEEKPYLGYWHGTFADKPEDKITIQLVKMPYSGINYYDSSDLGLRFFPNKYCDSTAFHWFQSATYNYFWFRQDGQSTKLKVGLSNKFCTFNDTTTYSKLEGFYYQKNEKLIIIYNSYYYSKYHNDKINSRTFTGFRF